MDPLTEDQLHHLSKLYSVSFTETEIHLLTTPTSSGRSRSGLTGLESQRAYLLHLALEPMECPACHGITCLRASALNPDADGSGHAPSDFDYACHHCKAKLRYHLGLIAGEQWWSLQVSGRMVEAADFLERGVPALLEPVYAQRLRTQCGKLDDVLGELWEHLPAPPPGRVPS